MITNRDIRDRVPPQPTEPRPDSPRRALISVEGAGWRDLLEVAELQRRAFRPQLAYGLTTLIVLKLLPHVRFLVARTPPSQGARILGCGIGDRHQGQTRIVNLAVDPSAQRRGIGTALLRALEAELPYGDLLLMVEQDNAAAQSLYRGEGYAEVGRAADYYGRGRSGIWMQKARPEAGGGSRPKFWV